MFFLALILFPSVYCDKFSVCKTYDSTQFENSSKSLCESQTVFFELKEDKGEKGHSSNLTELRVLKTNFTELKVSFEKYKHDTNQQLMKLETEHKKRNCPGVTFHFPRYNQITDYVKYLSYFSRMTETTVCAWIEKKPIARYPTVPRNLDFRSIFNYFTTDDDEVVIAITPSMQLTLKRRYEIRSLKKLSSEIIKFHFCICLSSSRSSLELFLNGTRQEKLNYSFANISGGGSLIIGNDQDVKQDLIMQKYQAFSGNITNLMVWSRYLEEEEISNIATKCECPQDYSVAMTMDKSEMHGDVSYSVPDQCPTV